MAPRRDPKGSGPSRSRGGQPSDQTSNGQPSDGPNRDRQERSTGSAFRKAGARSASSGAAADDRAGQGFSSSAPAGSSAAPSGGSPQTGPAAGLAQSFGAPTLRSSKAGRGPAATAGRRGSQKAIPDAVAQRMARRIALATGIPSLLGMGVFVGSYLLISRGIAEIAPGVTLVASGGCFLLGLLGLSYGVLSASWEEQPGSLLGQEQIGLNISRLRASIRNMRQAGSEPSKG